MLSDFWSFWFDVMQSVGSIATAIALAFVAYQSSLTRKQVTLAEKEMDINLRPWLYREKYSDGQEFHLQYLEERLGRILIMLKNSGKLAPTHVKAEFQIEGKEDLRTRIMTYEDLRTIFPNQQVEYFFMLDMEVLEKYKKGDDIYFRIIIKYSYGTKNDGEYGGDFTMSRQQPTGTFLYVKKEWVK